MPTVTLRSLAAAGLAAALLAAGAALPAAAGSQSAAQGQQAQAEQYTDAKLESFTVAAFEVRQLIQSWQPKIQNAENKDEAKKLQKQANSELLTVIEDTEGITVAEYKKIIRDVRADQELYDRVRGIAERVRQGQ